MALVEPTRAEGSVPPPPDFATLSRRAQHAMKQQQKMWGDHPRFPEMRLGGWWVQYVSWARIIGLVTMEVTDQIPPTLGPHRLTAGRHRRALRRRAGGVHAAVRRLSPTPAARDSRQRTGPVAGVAPCTGRADLDPAEVGEIPTSSFRDHEVARPFGAARRAAPRPCAAISAPRMDESRTRFRQHPPVGRSAARPTQPRYASRGRVRP